MQSVKNLLWAPTPLEPWTPSVPKRACRYSALNKEGVHRAFGMSSSTARRWTRTAPNVLSSHRDVEVNSSVLDKKESPKVHRAFGVLRPTARHWTRVRPKVLRTFGMLALDKKGRPSEVSLKGVEVARRLLQRINVRNSPRRPRLSFLNFVRSAVRPCAAVPPVNRPRKAWASQPSGNESWKRLSASAGSLGADPRTERARERLFAEAQQGKRQERNDVLSAQALKNGQEREKQN